MVVTQFSRDVPGLFLGVVSDAAHPQSERTQRWNRATAGERRVLREDLFGFAKEDEKVELFIPHVNSIRRVIGASKVEGERRASVHEHPVAAAAHKERHRFVHIRCLGAVSIDHPQWDLLATLVQACERLSTAKELLVRGQREGGGDPSRQIRGTTHERERRGVSVYEALAVRQVLCAGQYVP